MLDLEEEEICKVVKMVFKVIFRRKRKGVLFWTKRIRDELTFMTCVSSDEVLIE